MQMVSDRIQLRLKDQGIENPMANFKPTDTTQTNIGHHFKSIMEILKLDMDDDSLKDTPKRVAKMYMKEVFYGLDYGNFPAITTVENKFKVDEMVATKCTVMSLCEHHFVPFIGTAWVGYIPKTKILGLSKFNRIVDFFCRRPQVQERLTAQISTALSVVLETEDIGLVIKAEHLCVKLRGVKDQAGVTVTSKMTGKFMTVPSARQEFLDLTR
jgi:GTP cyclohydrolase I